MRLKRFILFFGMIALGIGAGLVYGWAINPAKYDITPPDTLRADYKADYVLMVAEIYHSDHNLPAAIQRLTFFGNQTALQAVNAAILTGQQIGYAQDDLRLMTDLTQALLQSSSSNGKTP